MVELVADGETTTLQCPTLNQLTVNQYEPGQGIGSHNESLGFCQCTHEPLTE